MEKLYPLKFKTQYMDKIWGGQKVRTHLGKDFGKLPNCGETWEISGVQDHVSVVSNGFLAGNSLEELIEVYMGDLVGDKVYERFGVEFPLLIKFIDANDDLSIQVHPDDELSKKRHQAFGKTEMWYVMQADQGAKLNLGFKEELTKEQYLEKFEAGKLMDILNFEEVKEGDVLFMPAGRVHAIGRGVLVAEIQQTSDVTYRIYDYERKDAEGNERELHTELALDAIDFTVPESYKTEYEAKQNDSVEVVKCDYFTTNVLELNQKMERDFHQEDSFVIYICLEGELTIDFEEGSESVKKGDTVLVPASLEQFFLSPQNSDVKLLEVHL
ncbi:type I phosphomannose isomerase catalytic subunit [Sunxiuqinia elliptica]|uniref:Phosphohexomutase n=1 Tax=Sunxiuqinia elliptica TaxID=655355 RepID=A0A4R6HBK0_9BACT|nr:type I phosphomannose isomerase catalytic subunit [Sunxiuqinia elliptica]TDO05338.1 mannose-6-phosphate isomerase type 1 [Sunxiuqinia elliptica]TDO64887.1 mannose-6-phosphate isomerase type 1 [Sunxiuqinia elliptica]